MHMYVEDYHSVNVESLNGSKIPIEHSISWFDESDAINHLVPQFRSLLSSPILHSIPHALHESSYSRATPTFTSPNPQIRPLHFRPRSITSVNVISLKNLLQSLTYRSLTFLWSLSQAHTYSVPSRILVPDLHNLAFSPHSSPFRVGIANQFCTWYC
jgi:hypothetical protein